MYLLRHQRLFPAQGGAPTCPPQPQVNSHPVSKMSPLSNQTEGGRRGGVTRERAAPAQQRANNMCVHWSTGRGCARTLRLTTHLRTRRTGAAPRWRHTRHAKHEVWGAGRRAWRTRSASGNPAPRSNPASQARAGGTQQREQAAYLRSKPTVAPRRPVVLVCWPLTRRPQ